MIWNESIFGIFLLSLAIGGGVACGGVIALAIIQLTKLLVEGLLDGFAAIGRSIFALLQFRPSMDEPDDEPWTLQVGSWWKSLDGDQYQVVKLRNREGTDAPFTLDGVEVEYTDADGESLYISSARAFCSNLSFVCAGELK